MSDVAAKPDLGKTTQGGRWLRWGMILTIVVASSLVAHLLQPKIGQARAPKLVVPEDRLDIGEVWESADFLLTLPVTNVTTTDLEITGFIGPCSCLTVNPKTLHIPAGETREIEIRIDLTQQIKSEPATLTQQIEIQVAPIVKQETDPVVQAWTIRGRVRKSYKVEPSSIDFGTIEEGQLKPATILVTPLRPLSGLTVSSPSDQFTAAVEKGDSKQNKYQVQVSPKAMTSAVQVSSEVILRGVDDAGQAIPPVSVQVTGVYRAEIQIVPASLLFGLRSVGRTVEGTVIVQSIKGDKLTVIKAESDSPGVQVKQVPSAVGSKGVSFQIILSVKRPGVNKGVIHFTVETKRGKRVKTTLEASCEGL